MMRILALALGIVVCLTANPGVAEQRYDYCALFQGKTVLFLVDRTDPYDQVDKEIISGSLDTVLQHLVPGDRLVIQTITDDFATGRRLFDRCKPGCPDQGILGYLVGSCRATIARRDAVTYREDYAKAVVPLVQEAEEYKGSAILETFSALSREYADARGLQILIFSDLVENTGLGNFEKMNDSAFHALLVKVQQLNLVPNVHGAEVVVFGFGRSQGGKRRGLSPEQDHRIERFWRDYFLASGAKTITITQRLEESYD